MKFQVENWSKLFYKIDVIYIDRMLKYLLKLEKDVLTGKKDMNHSLKLFLLKGISYENQQ